MSDSKTVSRSELFNNSDDISDNSGTDAEILPPQGFDFDIVDIDDDDLRNNTDNEVSDNKTKESENAAENEEPKLKEKNDKNVTFFRMFSTNVSSDAKNDDSGNIDNGLVKVIIDDVQDNNDDELLNPSNAKINDEEWDNIAKEINLKQRPLNYYYKPNNLIDHEKFKLVAVDGDTILKWNKQFKILSDNNLINLNEFNSKIDLYYSSNNQLNNQKKTKRLSKKKRDAKIFKRERIKEWKKNLKLAQQRAAKNTFRNYDDAKTSTKVKFGDSFKKRSTFTKKPNRSGTSNTNSNTRKPSGRVFRTE